MSAAWTAMSQNIPQNEVLTHGHLHENDNHGGGPTALPEALKLPGFPTSSAQINIKGFSYLGDSPGGFTRNPPTILPGQTLNFKNYDANPATNAFHTITDCREPCNLSTGIAYPVADGPVSFDSGELGFNGNNGSLAVRPGRGPRHVDVADRHQARYLHLLLSDTSLHAGQLPGGKSGGHLRQADPKPQEGNGEAGREDALSRDAGAQWQAGFEAEARPPRYGKRQQERRALSGT